MATAEISVLLVIKSWTFWYIDLLPMSSYTGVMHFQKWSTFFWPTLYMTMEKKVMTVKRSSDFWSGKVHPPRENPGYACELKILKTCQRTKNELARSIGCQKSEHYRQIDRQTDRSDRTHYHASSQWFAVVVMKSLKQKWKLLSAALGRISSMVRRITSC